MYKTDTHWHSASAYLALSRAKNICTPQDVGGSPGQASWQWGCKESHMALWKCWRALGEPQECTLCWAHSCPGSAPSWGLRVLMCCPGVLAGAIDTASISNLERSCNFWIEVAKDRQEHFPRVCLRTMGADCSSIEYVFSLQMHFSLFLGNSCPNFYYPLLLGACSVSHETSPAGRSAAGALRVRTTLWDRDQWDIMWYCD